MTFNIVLGVVNNCPTELSDEWYDILDKEYNIKDPVEDDREKVPPEFWTEEWWRKRGL